MTPSPKMNPPDPPEPCENCNEMLDDVEPINEQMRDDGAVVGDMACPNCGHIVASGYVFQNSE